LGAGEDAEAPPDAEADADADEPFLFCGLELGAI
jgi:hypothetical protein